MDCRCVPPRYQVVAWCASASFHAYRIKNARSMLAGLSRSASAQNEPLIAAHHPQGLDFESYFGGDMPRHLDEHAFPLHGGPPA